MCIRDRCQSMEVIAAKKNIELITNIEDNIIIKADYDKMRRLAVILIDNAVKYTEKGKVTVSLKTDKNKKVLIVEDTGIGISEKDLERIFDRFYRADKSRHREGGVGPVSYTHLSFYVFCVRRNISIHKNGI